MGKYRRPIAIFVVLFVVVTLLGLALFAFSGLTKQTTSGNIDHSSYLTGRTSLPVGGLFSYDLKVTSGAPVDVYIVTVDDYVNFINHRPFEYVESASFTNTLNASGSAYLGAGEYYIVVKPHNYQASTISLDLHGGPTIGQLIVIPIVALIVAGAAVLVMRWRRKRSAEKVGIGEAPQLLEGQKTEPKV